MGYAAATAGFFALGAYLGRDLSYGWAFAGFIAAFACLIGMNFAVRRSTSLTVGLLFAVGLLLGLAMAPTLVYYASANPQALWQAGGATALFIAGFGAAGYGLTMFRLIRLQKGPLMGTTKVDVTQLWAGGIATAVVAGLLALVGVLACRWLFGIPILAPAPAGAYGNAHTTYVVLAAAVAALIATALLHLLLLTTPRPLAFFGWIIGLATVIAVLFPFSTGVPLSQKFATGAVSLVIGIAIGSLLSGVAGRSIRLDAATGQ